MLDVTDTDVFVLGAFFPQRRGRDPTHMVVIGRARVSESTQSCFPVTAVAGTSPASCATRSSAEVFSRGFLSSCPAFRMLGVLAKVLWSGESTYLTQVIVVVVVVVVVNACPLLPSLLLASRL